MDKEWTTQEGQVTYPVKTNRTAGLPTGSSTSHRMCVAFLSLFLQIYMKHNNVRHTEFTILGAQIVSHSVSFNKTPAVDRVNNIIHTTAVCYRLSVFPKAFFTHYYNIKHWHN